MTKTEVVQLSDYQMRHSLALLEARRQRLGGDAVCDKELAALLSSRMVSLPTVRFDVVAAVRARLIAGDGPSSHDLASQILVGAPAGSPD